MEKQIRKEDVVAALDREIQECLQSLDLCLTDDEFRALKQQQAYLTKLKEQCLLGNPHLSHVYL